MPVELMYLDPAPTQSVSSREGTDLKPDSAAKRVFDVVGAAAGLGLLSPLLLVLSLFIWIQDRGPVLYHGRRVGRGGRNFRLYKFRTMVTGADRKGPGITTSGDARVTPVGRLLRKYKLDELPQLLNVLKGDMSLVGPRPEDPRYVALYSAEQRRILEVRPGLTSAASIQYRHEEALLSGDDWESVYRNAVMPEKLRIDLEYLQHRTFGSDIRLLFRTLLAIFR